MRNAMNQLERESLYLVTCRLMQFTSDGISDGFDVEEIANKLRDCYWRNNSNNNPNALDDILLDINNCRIKINAMRRALEETICCLDAIANSIDNALRNESQS